MSHFTEISVVNDMFTRDKSQKNCFLSLDCVPEVLYTTVNDLSPWPLMTRSSVKKKFVLVEYAPGLTSTTVFRYEENLAKDSL